MTTKTDTEILEDMENKRNGARLFSSAVYTGIVIAATTLFINFVLTAFPTSAYMSRFIMFISGLLVGASMLAFPVALHYWAVEKTHRLVTILFYYAEMAVVGLNTVVSFAVLLFKNSGAALPEWVVWYEPFSIISIVFTLLAWGTIFLSDPEHKANNKMREAQAIFRDKVNARVLEALDSPLGEAEIDAAMNEALLKLRRTGNNRKSVRPFRPVATRSQDEPEAEPVFSGNGRNHNI